MIWNIFAWIGIAYVASMAYLTLIVALVSVLPRAEDIENGA